MWHATLAVSPKFNGQCADQCHGLENVGGATPEGVPAPSPVRDISQVGITNSITTVPQHEILRLLRELGVGGGVTDNDLAVIAAELADLTFVLRRRNWSMAFARYRQHQVVPHPKL